MDMTFLLVQNMIIMILARNVARRYLVKNLKCVTLSMFVRPILPRRVQHLHPVRIIVLYSLLMHTTRFICWHSPNFAFFYSYKTASTPTSTPTQSPSTSPSKSPVWKDDGWQPDGWGGDAHNEYCLSRAACNEARTKLGLVHLFIGDYNSKGCYQKNGQAYWGKNGSEAEKTTELSGHKERSELPSCFCIHWHSILLLVCAW